MQQHKLLLAALSASLIFMHSTTSLAADSHSKKSLSLGNLPIQIGLSGLFSMGGGPAQTVTNLPGCKSMGTTLTVTALPYKMWSYRSAVQ